MSELQQCQNQECGAYIDSGGSPYCSRNCWIQSLEANVSEQAKEIERLRKACEWVLSGFDLDDRVEECLRGAIGGQK